jgi:hypothetical protein
LIKTTGLEESWQVNFCCAKNVKKRSKVVACVSIGTNTKERMNLSRIFKMIVWQLMCDVFGDFELGMECVLS